MLHADSFICPSPSALSQTLHADLFSGALLTTTSIVLGLNTDCDELKKNVVKIHSIYRHARIGSFISTV
jgi:hypothetical protein